MDNKNETSLSNRMVFSVLTDILSNVLDNKKTQTTDINSYIKQAKNENYDMSKIYIIKNKLLNNHQILTDKSMENILALLNMLDSASVKNKSTISVVLESILTEIKKSIYIKFNIIEELNKLTKFYNEKKSKNIEYFKEIVSLRYKLREFIIYVVFPMVYYFLVLNEIDENKLTQFKAKVRANGFTEENLIAVKKNIETIGFGASISLEEKIKSGKFLNKLGSKISIVETEDIGLGAGAGSEAGVSETPKLGTGASRLGNVVNTLNTAFSQVNKGGNQIPQLQVNMQQPNANAQPKLGTELMTSIGKQVQEFTNKETGHLSQIFNVLTKNREIVIILEVLELIKSVMLQDKNIPKV